MADLNAQINEARQHGYSDDDILSYLGQSRADLVPKIKEAQSHGYGASEIVGYLGASPPSQPSPLSKAAGAFWEGIGGKAALDILGGASRDPARAQKAADTVKALTAGIAAEPGRIWDELSRTGQSMLQGDLSGTAYHLAGSVPVFGAPAQQVANEVQQGKYAEAAGHTAALFAPFAAKPAAAAITPVAERAAATVADVATGPTATALRGGLVEAAKESAKKPPVGATLMGEMIGGHEGAAAAAVIAKAPAVARAFRAGAQQALLDRSLASAQEILGTSLDEFAQSVADKPYGKLDAATQAKVVDFYQKAAAARQAYTARTQQAPTPAAAPVVTPEPAPEPAPTELIPESRRLPAAPEAFEMPPATDSSYVRAVPAEYPEVLKPEVQSPAPPAAPAGSIPGTMQPEPPPALALRDAFLNVQKRQALPIIDIPPVEVPSAMPANAAKMTPAEAETAFQAQKARITGEEPPTPPAAPPSGGAAPEPLPEPIPERYRGVQERGGAYGIERAMDAFAKDQRIARYVLGKVNPQTGLPFTPDEWAALPLEEQNKLVREAPTKSGRGKHSAFVDSPSGGTRSAAEGISHITDTMRWMQAQMPEKPPVPAAAAVGATSSAPVETIGQSLIQQAEDAGVKLTKAHRSDLVRGVQATMDLVRRKIAAARQP